MIIPTLPILQYFVLRTRDPTVRRILTPVPGMLPSAWALEARRDYEIWLLAFVQARTGAELSRKLEVRDLPTARWGVSEDAKSPFLIVVACALANADAVETLRAALATGGAGRFLGMGTDAAIACSAQWRPGTGAPRVFGTDRSLLEAIHLTGPEDGPSGGHDTNIVVFDTGLDPHVVGTNRAPTIGGVAGGWAAKVQGSVITPTPPWSASAATAGHGTMVARAAVKVAGAAKLWDVPILPPAVGNLHQFLSDAHTAYLKVLLAISLFRQSGATSDRWVLVNAWGVYDRRAEEPDIGAYTENDAPGGHFFNRLIWFANHVGLDVVFAAGNSGPFFPHWRSGPHDWGPGRGIWGANAHKRALCVGAVRLDHIWLGYSSYGPGPKDKSGTGMLVQHKPDVCAPTDFADSQSAALRYTGTSGACGVAAGVVASLRAGHPPKGLYARRPARLRAEIRNTASLGTSVPDPALGFGVVDADRARAALA